MLARSTQSSGFKLINNYNKQGYLESIKSPVALIKDFDHEHFGGVLDRLLADGLEHYKTYLARSDEAHELEIKADYYVRISEQFVDYQQEFQEYAAKLRVYALRYKLQSEKHFENVERYRALVIEYTALAQEHGGTQLGELYKNEVKRFIYFRNKYVYWSGYYLTKAQRSENQADPYDGQEDKAENREEYNLEKAQDLYAEASLLNAQAQRAQDLALMAGGTHRSLQAAQAYEEMLNDEDYVYHYKVLKQNSLGQITKYLNGNGLITEDIYDRTGVLETSITGYNHSRKGIRELHYEYDKNYNVTSREDTKLNKLLA